MNRIWSQGPGPQKNSEAEQAKKTRDPQDLETLAEAYARAGKYTEALTVAEERRALAFRDAEAELAFNLKVGAWAEASGDLLLAKRIYLGGHDPQHTLTQQQNLYVKADYEAAYIALHRDPHRWIQAARQKVEVGDVLGAEALLLEAERNNTFTVFRRKELPQSDWPRLIISPTARLGVLNDETTHDGGRNLEATKLSADGDTGIQKEIEALRAEISSFEAKLPARLDAEIKSLEVQAIHGDKRTRTHLKHAYQMKRDLNRLNAWQTQIRRLEVASLIRKARLDLTNGFFQRNKQLWKAGLRAVAALDRYAAAEAQKDFAFSDLAKLYPEGTPLVFISDLSDSETLQPASAYDMRPAAKAVEASQLMKTLTRLKKDDPALAAHMERVLADCRATRISHERREFLAETGFTYDMGEEIAGYREPEAAARDVAALKRRTLELEDLYGKKGDLTSPLSRFALAVDADEKAANLQNDGFRYRQDVQYGIANLKSFREAELPPAQWLEFYAARANNYENFLEEEVVRARKQDEEDSKNQANNTDYVGEPTPPIHTAEKQAQARLDALRSELSRLSASLEVPNIKKIYADLSGMDKMKNADFLERWPLFGELSQKAQEWQEAHVQGLLRWQIGEIEKISPEAKDRVRPLRGQLELDSNPDPDPKAMTFQARLRSYAALQGGIDREALRAEISHTAETYQTMKKEVDLHDGIWNGLGAFFTTVTDPIVDSIDPSQVAKWSEFNTGGNFVLMEKKYDALLKEFDGLAYDETAAINSVKERFLRLNNMAIHQGLQAQFQDAATFNRYTIGVGIVLASAATAGLFGAGVGALGGGTLLQGAANAAVFTLASRVYHGALYDGLDGVGEAFVDIGKNPLGYIEESLLNWAMFTVIGKSAQGFGKFFEGRLHNFALGRLVEEGVLAEGTTVTEEVLAKNPALRAAYQKERLLLENALPEVGRRLGTFGTEAVVFQIWGFLMDNYQLFKQGRFDLLGAVKRNFLSGNAWLHSMAFLGALRVGHNFATAGLGVVKVLAGAASAGYGGFANWVSDPTFVVGMAPSGTTVTDLDAGQAAATLNVDALKKNSLFMRIFGSIDLVGSQDPRYRFKSRD